MSIKNQLAITAILFCFVANASADIFQEIWNLPESHVSVSRRGDDGNAIDPAAKVTVDEQGQGGRCLTDDHAPRPLLSNVDESLFEEPSFKTFIALLDNYKAAQRVAEVEFDNNAAHWSEVNDFLDVMFRTKPVRRAIDHIQTDLRPGIQEADIRIAARRMWFEPFTNNYSKPMEHCVGFEHVFVGEDESTPANAPPCADRVGGYHSWVKFYLDEKAGKANYLGYDYPDANVTEALADPKVTTIVMKWSPTIEEGSHGHDLLKKPGGFFVGTRPELEFAFGLVGMVAIQADKFDNVAGKQDHHRVRLGQNLFDLVLHPQSLAPPRGNQPPKRGPRIRTMYPKFRGSSISIESSVASVDLPTQPRNDAAIRILRALPNPIGNDALGGEWVELENVTEDTAFDLSEWRLTDQLGRAQPMTGELSPGETKKIDLLRADETSMMLRNKSGWILLYQADQRRAAVQYPDPKSGVIIEFQ